MGLIIKNGVIYNGAESDPVVYSLDEREVGVWTDGKPLYQKTWNFQTVKSLPANGNWLDTGISASYIEKIVDARGYRSDTNYILINAGLNQSNNIAVMHTRNSTLDDFAGLTIQYTKTTDTPGSGTWTPSGVKAEHYSTNEHVVGTWIDGSTIYERTLTSDTVTKGSWTNIGNALTWGIDTVVELVGSYKRTWSSNSMQAIPYYESANVNASVRYHSSQGIQYRINDEVDNSVSKLKVTIRYTKTTS